MSEKTTILYDVIRARINNQLGKEVLNQYDVEYSTLQKPSIDWKSCCNYHFKVAEMLEIPKEFIQTCIDDVFSHSLNLNSKDLSEQHLSFLKDKQLYELIEKEISKKVEGEKECIRAIFLTFNMRNVRNLSKATDNLMVNDPGGTGKDHVVSAVFEILPEEEKLKRIRISPKVLSYLNDVKSSPAGWTKKALYLEDIPNSVLNDDCFKVMSSTDPNGISKSSIVVNNALKDIEIRGKPSIVITIASSDPKQETLRRYPICNLTGTINQTKAILKRQAEFAVKGKSLSYDPKIKGALQGLKRIEVSIPYATLIAECFPSGNVISRTHFPRFLDYIKSSCALYQYQRELNEDDQYIATEQDYMFAREVLITTTTNQFMIPLTRQQNNILDFFEKGITYTVSDLEPKGTKIGLGDRQLRRHLDKLSEYGLLERTNEKREESNKPLAVYSLIEVHKIELPTFTELKKMSNMSTMTNETNETNMTNTNKSGVNDINDVFDNEIQQSKIEINNQSDLLSFIQSKVEPVSFDEIKKITKHSAELIQEFLDYYKKRGDLYETKPNYYLATCN